MSPPLPSLLSSDLVRERLLRIFPEGAPNRVYCTRDIAASTVFAFLYIGAIEGRQQFLGPKQVVRMSDEQAERTSDADRSLYAAESIKSGFVGIGTAWYADNTRERIRDETLRQGLRGVGAVVELKSLPPSSSKPRYALAADFALLLP